MRRGASRLMRRDTPSAVVVLWTVHCRGVYETTMAAHLLVPDGLRSSPFLTRDA